MLFSYYFLNTKFQIFFTSNQNLQCCNPLLSLQIFFKEKNKGHWKREQSLLCSVFLAEKLNITGAPLVKRHKEKHVVGRRCWWHQESERDKPWVDGISPVPSFFPSPRFPSQTFFTFLALLCCVIQTDCWGELWWRMRALYTVDQTKDVSAFSRRDIQT